MARIRTIKPTHHSDRKLPEISLQAHLLWVLNWCWSDDEGIFENDPLLIKSNNFPRRNDIRVEQITQWLDQLVKARYIIPFTYNGGGYYINRTFKTHQKIDRPQASKIPLDVIRSIRKQFVEHSSNDQEHIDDQSSLYSIVEDSRVKESKGDMGAPSAPTAQQNFDKKNDEGGRRKIFVPPTLAEVEQYFIEVMGDTKQSNPWPEDKCKNQAGKFWDHYKANGWVQAKNKPIKDWQSACRNWIRNELDGTYGPPRKSEAAPPPVPVADSPPPIPALPKTAVEINYLFERFLEGQVTIISVEVVYYDYLKKTGKIVWPPGLVEKIKKRATDHIEEKQLPADGPTELKFMKLFGVLEYFEQWKAAGNKTVYDEKDLV